MHRPTLFVSMKCAHCRELLERLHTAGRSKEYEVLEIESLAELPPFLDRVPMLTTSTGVVSDDELFDAVFPSVAPGGDFAMYSKMSSSFAPLEDAAGGAEAAVEAVNFLDAAVETVHIETPEETYSSNKSGVTESLESLRSLRSKETPKVGAAAV